MSIQRPQLLLWFIIILDSVFDNNSKYNMAKSGQVELYTTDFALDANGASYKGLIVVNKVL